MKRPYLRTTILCLAVGASALAYANIKPSNKDSKSADGNSAVINVESATTADSALDATMNAAQEGLAHAQVKLGLMYEQGEQLEVDVDQAAFWYRLAANQNHPQGQYNLALLYIYGVSVAQDATLATYWLERAAANGYMPAIIHLARNQEMYFLQDGADIQWIKIAASRGDALSQLSLAQWHLSDKHMDTVKAEFWLTNAAEYDSAEAQKLLVEFYSLSKYQRVNPEKANYWQTRYTNSQLVIQNQVR
ncbi:tetratricopeptide repeat protein [Vibrio tapetis]|uniref:Sel1 repeat family protein n=1 Tax=Vibrio tapetis subsp. tapetis TaxID=1671868 RepID=A0A2N8ZIR6_9VIBR|nr:tetratricopeptide repeat protein [Vibrio tapetis]SON51798.1 exported protein of unknown function [Vibrio tapetis subsp. tapetis]